MNFDWHGKTDIDWGVDVTQSSVEMGDSGGGWEKAFVAWRRQREKIL